LPTLCRVLLKCCKGCTLWYSVTVIVSGSNKSNCQSNTSLRSLTRDNIYQTGQKHILKTVTNEQKRVRNEWRGSTSRFLTEFEISNRLGLCICWDKIRGRCNIGLLLPTYSRILHINYTF
jgi:hypothetical protein